MDLLPPSGTLCPSWSHFMARVPVGLVPDKLIPYYPLTTCWSLLHTFPYNLHPAPPTKAKISQSKTVLVNSLTLFSACRWRNLCSYPNEGTKKCYTLQKTIDIINPGNICYGKYVILTKEIIYCTPKILAYT
jgi:hypothetical protein